MTLPLNKTKIVATIGPASDSPEILEQLILAGMNVARLNFSHGDEASHKMHIETIRRVAGKLDRRVAILADLPGPKMRIGELAEEPVELQAGDPFTLTVDEIIGDRQRVAVTQPRFERPYCSKVVAAQLGHGVLEVGEKQIGRMRRARLAQRAHTVNEWPAREREIGSLVQRPDNIEAGAHTTVEDDLGLVPDSVFDGS